MPTIVQALKKYGGEYRYGGRELSWSKAEKRWVVSPLGLGKPLCLTPCQYTAVDFLLKKR